MQLPGQVKQLKGEKSVVRSMSIDSTGGIELKGPKSVVRSRRMESTGQDKELKFVPGEGEGLEDVLRQPPIGEVN